MKDLDNWLKFEDTEDPTCFRDGSVVCMDTKGHSRGHQLLAVSLPNSGKRDLTAGAVAMTKTLKEGVPPSVL